MKARMLRICGASRQRCVLIVCLFGVTGCNGPAGFIPGGRLSGPEETTTSWDVAAAFENFELEIRPTDPYSVRVNFVLREGNLYVDPTEDRTWGEYLKADANVRVRFAETIYPAVAVEVTSAEERQGFDADRRVYRLEPVDSP